MPLPEKVTGSITRCAVCHKQHSWPENMTCLDCHARLEYIGPQVLRCRRCLVIHRTLSGKLLRALTPHAIDGEQVENYSDLCRLSSHLPSLASPFAGSR